MDLLHLAPLEKSLCFSQSRVSLSHFTLEKFQLAVEVQADFSILLLTFSDLIIAFLNLLF